MLITLTEKPRWLFYAGWVVLHVVAAAAAWYLTWGAMKLVTQWVGDRIQVAGQSHITEDFLFMYVLFPAIGLVSGVLQYLLLRRFFPHAGWWIAATVLGWLTPFAVGALVISVLGRRNDTLSIMVGLLVMGMVIAVPQWWLLRRRVRYAWCWIPAYGIGWCLAGLLNLVTTEPLPVILAIACLPAVGTAFACWLLLDRLPRLARQHLAA
jgi:hypothetical protein